MIGEVPEIAHGEKLTWSTAGKHRFIHRQSGNITLDEDGEFAFAGPCEVMVYHATAGFDAYPWSVGFHSPGPGSVCILESVLSQDQEQIMAGFGFDIFAMMSFGEPLAVAWPMFNQEHPLLLRFFNPLERALPPFCLSLFVSAPKDFAERWVKDGQAEKD